MKYGVLELLTLLGSLGIILFGLKSISESLQKIAGERMRGILSTMPTSSLKGILAGFFVTTVIQSSSATTLMVVSFVNVGLLTLVQSISVIMGTNIGATITAWIVSIFGFKYNIILWVIPLIGFGVPLFLTKKTLLRSWGELILGFSFLFIGLDFLKTNVEIISSLSIIKSWLAAISYLGFSSTLIYLSAGIILSVTLQSSSAAIIFTFVLGSIGMISIENAVAMVLGENVGTTFIANYTARVANISAKRSARVHLFFNLFGVFWMLVFFNPVVSFLSKLFQISPSSTLADNSLIPITLSVFHSGINIINTLILVWFTPVIVKIVAKIIPLKESDENKNRLMHLGIGLLSTAEFSLIQAKKEILVFAKRSQKMFGFVKDLFSETNENSFNTIYQRIEKYENISDRVEVEIATYLNKISSHQLRDETTVKIRSMFKIISDIESISDCNYSIARILRRKHDSNIWFSQNMTTGIQDMFSLLEEAFSTMVENINSGTRLNLAPAVDVENRINNLRNRLKEDYIKDFEKTPITYQSGVIYHDLFSVLEKLGDYLLSVSRDITESKKTTLSKFPGKTRDRISPIIP